MHHRRAHSVSVRPLHSALEVLEDRSNPSTAFLATDLISDQPGVAPITDPTLLNAWGISLNPAAGAFWVSSNGGDLSEVYIGDVGGSPLAQPFKVAIPGGAPTGQVFNGTGSTTDFSVTDGTNTMASVFIFASESGAITGWNPAVGVSGTPPSRAAEAGFQADDGAIYKGLALATIASGNFLYAADFHNNKIDVIDGQFHRVTLGQGDWGTFTDSNLPPGFAPFNVALINGKIFVSYAKQDADAEDDVTGRGLGFVNVFDTTGHFLQRFASRDVLDAPWGMVAAPDSFGDFGGAILIGNFGNGRINAFDPNTGKRLGTLTESRGHPVEIDGLWGLAFGNGVSAGDANSLYYAAGPDDEAHGLFGKITANAEGTNPVSATLTDGDLTIMGSRNDDKVSVQLQHGGSQIVVRAGRDRIGEFDAAEVGTIHFNGFAGNDAFRVDGRIDAIVFADGGAGDDVLNGGNASAVLLGNTGNDFLFGGSSRDILVGGDGRDFLFGGGADDILIGGRTTHDENAIELSQLLAAWNSSDSYATRVATIRAGTGGVPKLDTTTVLDDAARDDLFGGPGLDWFIGQAPDVFHGMKDGELTN